MKIYGKYFNYPKETLYNMSLKDIITVSPYLDTMNPLLTAYLFNKSFFINLTLMSYSFS